MHTPGPPLTPLPPWCHPMAPASSGPYRRPLCPPRAGTTRPGAGYGFPLEESRSPGLTWAVSKIHARAGRCREVGLSSTDERVSGHVSCMSPKSHRLFGSRLNGPRVIYTYIVEMTYMLTDLDSTCWTGFMSAVASAKHGNFIMST